MSGKDKVSVTDKASSAYANPKSASIIFTIIFLVGCNLSSTIAEVDCSLIGTVRFKV